MDAVDIILESGILRRKIISYAEEKLKFILSDARYRFERGTDEASMP